MLPNVTTHKYVATAFSLLLGLLSLGLLLSGSGHLRNTCADIVWESSPAKCRANRYDAACQHKQW
jgi:hypothetical protein